MGFPVAEVFIFLVVVGVGAVIFLVIQSGGGLFGMSAPHSARPVGPAGSPQSAFQNAGWPFQPNSGNLKPGGFPNVKRGNVAQAVVRPSGDYTGLFRGKEGTPQPVARQVYALPVDKTGAPPPGMTQAVYARQLAGANPKVAAEIIQQWIRSG